MSGESITAAEGEFRETDATFIVIVTRWNHSVVDNLLTGALNALRNQGIPDESITINRVPGAFEIPLACQVAAARVDCDAVIALGAVIRGDTPHFQYVAGECARGISQVSLESGKPIIFGVLTVDSMEQAMARSSPNTDNKGAEAALSALDMVKVIRELRS